MREQKVKTAYGDVMFTPCFPIQYVQGYTAALMDVLDVLDYIEPDMKRNKVQRNFKNVRKILKVMIENRSILREDCRAFVRCAKDGEFEMFIGRD